jgi:hypothetical protein
MALPLLGVKESKPVLCGTGGGLNNLSPRQAPSLSDLAPALAALHTGKDGTTYQ